MIFGVAVFPALTKTIFFRHTVCFQINIRQSIYCIHTIFPKRPVFADWHCDKAHLLGTWCCNMIT